MLLDPPNPTHWTFKIITKAAQGLQSIYIQTVATLTPPPILLTYNIKMVRVNCT